MMTQEERMGLTGYMFDAYDRACKKQPKFHDGKACGWSIEGARKEEAASKAMCAIRERTGRLSFLDLIREELAEYFVASLNGDVVQAREELLDCFAVLMREWERITEK